MMWGICHVIGGMCSGIEGILSPARNKGYVFGKMETDHTP